MASPSTRPESRQLQFRRKIPADLKGRVEGKRVLIEYPESAGHEAVLLAVKVGAEGIKASLRTTEKGVARLRAAAANAAVEKLFDGLRKGPSPLSHRQVVALSGEVYVALVTRWQDDPGSEESWASWKGWSRAVMQGRVGAAPTATFRDAEDVGRAVERFGRDLTAGIDAMPPGEPSDEGLEQRFGFMADFALARHGLTIDAPTRLRLLQEVGRASVDAGWMLKRAAGGDYSPDPKAARFPAFDAAKKDKSHSDTVCSTITGLLESWWREAKATGRTPSTYQSYEATIRGFVGFLAHDDVSKVTPDEVVAYKDHRLSSINPRTGKPISPKTVADSDLTALKSVFAWGVANRKLKVNPAAGITIKMGKPVRMRQKSFTDDEANALLNAAGERVKGNERQKTFDAIKWAPWLLCYTGARVGEVAQLRKKDVRKEGNRWIIEITPEAGTVKDKDARVVVLHDHLVELGFPAFASAAAAGHLFLSPSKNGDVLGPLQGVVNRITEAARETVTDRRVQPNHAWRHRFKRILRDVGVGRDISHAITGHDNDDVGDDYGEVNVEAQALALSKFPRQG